MFSDRGIEKRGPADAGLFILAKEIIRYVLVENSKQVVVIQLHKGKLREHKHRRKEKR
ncbi:hypothetical protein [Neobacillus notoginsengisoli]|uniref:hypothetical protein n=1 Tax=Neobacillus notoginsengisoli TaxID=1578198 RepID=UPI001314FA65|nr:hypothetical protein [Neobacillus notoginsengisoli]